MTYTDTQLGIQNKNLVEKRRDGGFWCVQIRKGGSPWLIRAALFSKITRRSESWLRWEQAKVWFVAFTGAGFLCSQSQGQKCQEFQGSVFQVVPSGNAEHTWVGETCKGERKRRKNHSRVWERVIHTNNHLFWDLYYGMSSTDNTKGSSHWLAMLCCWQFGRDVCAGPCVKLCLLAVVRKDVSGSGSCQPYSSVGHTCHLTRQWEDRTQWNIKQDVQPALRK